LSPYGSLQMNEWMDERSIAPGVTLAVDMAVATALSVVIVWFTVRSLGGDVVNAVMTSSVAVVTSLVVSLPDPVIIPS